MYVDEKRCLAYRIIGSDKIILRASKIFLPEDKVHLGTQSDRLHYHLPQSRVYWSKLMEKVI